MSNFGADYVCVLRYDDRKEYFYVLAELLPRSPNFSSLLSILDSEFAYFVENPPLVEVETLIPRMATFRLSTMITATSHFLNSHKRE